MTTRTWTRLGIAGLLAMAGAGCASRQQTASDPTAMQIQGSQKQSQEALDRAKEAQQKASDQQKQVAKAQQDVDDAQRRLNEAQQKLRSEQEKAEQLQRAANEETRDATRQAQLAQQQATRGLERQGEQVASNRQVIQGQVTSTSANRLAVKPETGEPVSLEVSDSTRITVYGRRATLQEVLPGSDARVSYEVSGTTPTAISVEVLPPGGGSAPPPPAGQGSSSGGTTENGSPTGSTQESGPQGSR